MRLALTQSDIVGEPLASKLNRSQSGEARDSRLRRLLSLQKCVETDQIDGAAVKR